MGQTVKPTRQNRTITVDCHDETTYSELLGNTKTFLAAVFAFLLAIGFQLTHQATCHGGGRCLTRHSHYNGRVIWHLGYTTEASATAFTQSYRMFHRAALQQEPSYRVRGILTDGFDSTVKSMRTLFPGARLGNYLRHAINKLPKKLAAIASPVRKVLRSRFHTLLYRVRQRKGLRVFALGQRLRRFADHVAHTAGAANGERVRRWFQEKKVGWYVVLADPQMPVTSTLLDQAHNAIERKLFAMKGFHHPGGSQRAFLTGPAHHAAPRRRPPGESGRFLRRAWSSSR